MHERAIRRHQQKLAKARARRLLARWDVPPTPAEVGIHAATRVLCSCWMCGNPRKYLGEVSRQEQLAEGTRRTEIESARCDRENDEEDRADACTD